MSFGRRVEKAAEYLRRAPNYSGEAIEEFRRWSNPDYPETERLTKWFASQLEAAHKFALPFGGRLFDRPPTADDLSTWRAPYPLVAFEFEANAGRGGSADSVMPVVVLVSEGDGWTWLYLISKQPNGWSPCAFWAAFRRDVDGACGADLREVVPQLGMDSGSGIRMGVLPELAELVARERGVTPENVSEWAARYLGPALFAAVQVCVVLACTNVSTDIIRPNREARLARPASTLFDYHILMIRPGAERGPSEDCGGSHASPRTHLRRGHIRRHPTAGRIWVNSTIVNPTAIGSVNKDYRVSR